MFGRAWRTGVFKDWEIMKKTPFFDVLRIIVATEDTA
jgi:hypothetical protein